MATPNEPRLFEQTESIAEILFIIIVIVMLGGPVAGGVLSVTGWASSLVNKQKLGARLSYSEIPFFEGVEALLDRGLCPTGTRKNLEFAAPLTTFTDGLSYSNQLLLADAQTSGGLLIAVPKASLDELLKDLNANNVLHFAVIGQVIRAEQPAIIHVGL